MNQKQYELQFYQNRSTPQVLLKDEAPRPKANYGKPTSRRPVNDNELKTISRGGWVRVDEKGNTPKSPDYTKTQYRPWLVQPVSKSAFGVEHISKRTLFNPYAPKRGLKWLRPKNIKEWPQYEYIGLTTPKTQKGAKHKKLQKVKTTIGTVAESGQVGNTGMAGRGILSMLS